MAFLVNPVSSGLSLTKPSAAKAEQAGKSFSQWLQDSVEMVEQLQQVADQKAIAFARGEDVDIHSVMLAAEHASLALNYLLAIRTRLLEAYQEIMRMQI